VGSLRAGRGRSHHRRRRGRDRGDPRHAGERRRPDRRLRSDRRGTGQDRGAAGDGGAVSRDRGPQQEPPPRGGPAPLQADQVGPLNARAVSWGWRSAPAPAPPTRLQTTTYAVRRNAHSTAENITTWAWARGCRSKPATSEPTPEGSRATSQLFHRRKRPR